MSEHISTSGSSIAVRASSDAPELEEHSSEEMLAFVRHHSDRAEVR
jgi:hypothetical protein